MTTETLPPVVEAAPEAPAAPAVTLEDLPEPLRAVCQENPHLLEYIGRLPIAEIGIPVYATELTRKHGESKQPNVIYPVHRGSVFVHVLYDKDDVRSRYIPIEPSTKGLDKLMADVETKLLDLHQALPEIDPEQDKAEQSLHLLDLVTSVTDQPTTSVVQRTLGLLRKSGLAPIKLRVSPREQEALRYLFVRDKIDVQL